MRVLTAARPASEIQERSKIVFPLPADAERWTTRRASASRASGDSDPGGRPQSRRREKAQRARPLDRLAPTMCA